MEEIKDAVTRQKLSKMNYILEIAIELFCDLGIEATKMEDIATKANVGTATVYRYFSTKAEIAIQSATLFWKNESERYLNILKEKKYDTLTGIEQVEVILNLFERLFENSPQFLKFLQEFDIFIKKNGILMNRLKEYENTILNLQPHLTKALEKGLIDQTVVLQYSIEETYFAITHAILSLMQKLALNGDILDSDSQIESGLQVKIIVNLLLKGIEKRSNKDEGINK